jgi:hypothetical protein
LKGKGGGGGEGRVKYNRCKKRRKQQKTLSDRWEWAGVLRPALDGMMDLFGWLNFSEKKVVKLLTLRPSTMFYSDGSKQRHCATLLVFELWQHVGE